MHSQVKGVDSRTVGGPRHGLCIVHESGFRTSGSTLVCYDCRSLRGTNVKKRMVVAAVLAALLTTLADAQTTNFFELARTGTPQSVQAAINQGADINGHNEHGWTEW